MESQDDDDPVTLLEKAKEEVIISGEWKQLRRELLEKIQQLEYLRGEGQLRSFSELPVEEKTAAIARAVETVKDTETAMKLKAKVADSLDRHFTGEARRAGQAKASRNLEYSRIQQCVHQSAVACSHLLSMEPHLKANLRKCFNHPLPPELRAEAWKAFLPKPKARTDFSEVLRMRQNTLQPQTIEEKRVYQKCEAILSGNSFFSELADSVNAVKAMKIVMLFWGLQNGLQISDTEFLMCIPFVCAQKANLAKERPDSNGFQRVVADLLEQYVCFMELVPISMHRNPSESAQEGMNLFALHVGELLVQKDKELYQAMQRAFGIPAARRRASSSADSASEAEEEGQLSFHKRLRNLIQPYVRKMLVGSVPMDVVCYIWDQCLMGIDNPGYQCFPYFTTVWLILHRQQLMQCQTVRDMENALLIPNPSLTVSKFQNEIIKKKFYLVLKSKLFGNPLDHDEPGARDTTDTPGLSASSSSTSFSSSSSSSRHRTASEQHSRGRVSGLGRLSWMNEPDALQPRPRQHASHGTLEYIPSQLTQSHLQEIWLKIFENFADATSLVCHGTATEES